MNLRFPHAQRIHNDRRVGRRLRAQGVRWPSVTDQGVRQFTARDPQSSSAVGTGGCPAAADTLRARYAATVRSVPVNPFSPTFGVRSLSLSVGVVALAAALEVGVGPEVVTWPMLLAGFGIGALWLRSLVASPCPRSPEAQLGDALSDAGVAGAAVSEIMEENTAARLDGLWSALAVLAIISLVALVFSRRPQAPATR